MAEATPPASTPAPDAPVRKKRRFRGWGRIVGLSITALLVVLIVVVLLLPTLLSTGAGKNAVLGVVNGSIKGTLDIGELDLSWFSGQAAREITLRDPRGGVVAEVAALEAPDADILPLAMGSRQLGVVRVREPVVQIRQEAGPGGSTNLEQAIEPRDPAPPRKGGGGGQGGAQQPTDLGDVGVTLEVTAGRITYESPEIEMVEVSDLNATVAAPTLGNIGIDVSGDFRQGEQTGTIAADLTVKDAVTKGQPTVERAQLDGTAEVTNVPIPVVDRLAGQEGKLVALLGETLTANLAAAGGLSDLNVEVAATSPRLKTFNTKLVTQGDTLRAEEANVQLELTPEAYALWAGESAGTLDEAMVVDVSVPTFEVPRGAGGAVALERAKVQGNVTIPRVALTLPPAEAAEGEPEGEAMPVRVDDLVLDFGSDALGKGVTAILKGLANIAGESGQINAQLAAANLPIGENPPAEPLRATLQANSLPIPLADAVAGQGGKLTQTIGRWMNANATVTQQANGTLDYDATLRAPRLEGRLVGAYATDGLMTVRTESPLRLTLTPDAYRAWLTTPDGPPPAMEPVEDIALEITTDSSVAIIPPEEDAPADAPTKIDPERTRVALQVTTPRAALRNAATRERYNVEQLRLAANGQNLREVLEVLANMRILPEGVQVAPGEGGAVASKTTIRNLVAADGTVQPKAASFATETNARELPSALIDSLAGQGGQLAALLGATTTAAVNGAYEPGRGGNLDVAVRSANVRGKIPGTIDGEGNVTIPTAVLDVNVTPEVGQAMLKNINPLLGSAVSAEAPLRLAMSGATFRLPVDGRGVDWSKVNANARLTSKGLTINNTGALGILTRLVGTFVQDFGARDAYTVDISDLPMRVQKGVLSYQNLGLALGNLNLNFGGNVNLGTSAVDMQMRFADDFPVRELRGVSVPIGGSADKPVFSRESLQKALVGAAAGGLLENLIRDRGDGDQRDRGQPRGDEPIGRQRDRQPRQPVDGERPVGGESQPRGGVEGLLGDLLDDALGTDEEAGQADRQETAEERERRLQRQQQQRRERIRRQQEQLRREREQQDAQP